MRRDNNDGAGLMVVVCDSSAKRDSEKQRESKERERGLRRMMKVGGLTNLFLLMS